MFTPLHYKKIDITSWQKMTGNSATLKDLQRWPPLYLYSNSPV